MSIRAPRETESLADLYGLEPLPWGRALSALGRGSLGPETPCFLATVRSDGRPHCAGIGLVERDGELYFTAGPATRKARNIAENPACTLSMRLDGIDLIFEGDAHRVVDPAMLGDVAAVFRAGGWPAVVEGDALSAPYSAPSAGPPPWHLYRVNVRTAFGVALREPGGATRWRF